MCKERGMEIEGGLHPWLPALGKKTIREEGSVETDSKNTAEAQDEVVPTTGGIVEEDKSGETSSIWNQLAEHRWSPLLDDTVPTTDGAADVLSEEWCATGN